MNDYIQMFAFGIAATLPFILITKWRHWGVVVSVLFGWALVFLFGQLFPTNDRFQDLGAVVGLEGLPGGLRAFFEAYEFLVKDQDRRGG